MTQLHSVAGLMQSGLIAARPFRAPHHTVSVAGLLGGGTGFVRPGEVSLAHHGVLFLDELNEFRRDAIEGLRQPLEDGRVVVTRAVGSIEFPATFTLVAAANPCPCGYDGDPRRHCDCLPHRIQLYRQKLSGPLLDRIDIRLVVPRLSRAELLSEDPGESSTSIRERVEVARSRQRVRYGHLHVPCNAQLPGPRVGPTRSSCPSPIGPAACRVARQAGKSPSPPSVPGSVASVRDICRVGYVPRNKLEIDQRRRRRP